MGWLDRPLGRAVMACESDALVGVLKGMPPFPEALCIAPQSCDSLIALLAENSRRLHVLAPAAGNALEGEPGSAPRPERLVWGLPEALPFSRRELDLVVLIHCLEFSRSPYAILAETERVLAPGGRVVVLAFNPVSLFGLARVVRGKGNTGPWSGRFHSPPGLRRMLESTGLVYEGTRYLFRRPPIDRKGVLRSLRFLDRRSRGGRLPFGGVACFRARKEEPGLTLLGPAFRAELGQAEGGRVAASPYGRVA